MWLSPSHLAGWASGPTSEIWLPKLAGWLGLWPSQPNVAAKILKWLETCFQRFHDSATLGYDLYLLSCPLDLSTVGPFVWFHKALEFLSVVPSVWLDHLSLYLLSYVPSVLWTKCLFWPFVFVPSILVSSVPVPSAFLPTVLEPAFYYGCFNFFLILNKIIQKSTIFNIECYDREHVSQIKVHKNNLIIAIKN